MRFSMQLLVGLLIGCLSLLGKLDVLHATPFGEHVDRAGCVRVTVVKGPITTTTTTTTTARPPTTNATVAPG